MIVIKDEADFDGLLDKENFVAVFTAPSWCAPCRALKPVLESVDGHTDYPFVIVDIDDNPWAVSRFGVLGVPQMLQFKDGEAVREIRGRRANDLIAEINLI